MCKIVEFSDFFFCRSMSSFWDAFVKFFITLVNVYVDLVVFTHIAGTS